MLGQSGGNVKPQGAILSYPKSTRMDQIEKEVAVHQTMSRKPMSMRQIARRLNMSASGHLMSILWDMVDDGRLISEPRPYRDTTAWDFRVPPDRMLSVLDKVYGK